MTLRQTALAILTVLVVFVSAGPALVGSLQEQQISDRLELYQTDMVLQASELTLAVEDDQRVPVQVALVGKAPIETGLKAYQKTRQTAQETLDRLDSKIQQLTIPPTTAKTTAKTMEASSDGSSADRSSSDRSSSDGSSADGSLADGSLADGSLADGSTTVATSGKASLSNDQRQAKLKELRTNRQTQQQLIEQLDINIGILQTQQGGITAALETWASLSSSPPVHSARAASFSQTLTGLWAEPPTIAPEAEQQIQQQLTGWFRDRALVQLYTLQDDAIALATLQQTAQDAAQQTAQKLVLIGVGPVMGCIIGIGLIIFLVVQRFVSGQTAILAGSQAQQWNPQWDWETTWQVIIVGFFFVGQLVVPIMFQIVKPLLLSLGRSMSLMEGQLTALLTLMVYIAMSAATIGVLYWSIKSYLPLTSEWFRTNLQEKWWLWGLGGYVVAVPLVIGVSIGNEHIWQGRGGSNPLLQIVLEEGNSLALGVFFFTAAIAAPIFEEILFRGFILPSLTRYTSTWGAIILSSLLFAIAHLSVSEILPLMILGCVLGFVYTRSKNLLAPMMVHSLWNSATMVGLLVLGSSLK